MQCRSHSRRHTGECLFVTACNMDEYAEEKRTEKNLIIRSGISEAETTNNKRLRSTFCIEAIQTRTIARPLRDSRASCTSTSYVPYLSLSADTERRSSHDRSIVSETHKLMSSSVLGHLAFSLLLSSITTAAAVVVATTLRHIVTSFVALPFYAV